MFKRNWMNISLLAVALSVGMARANHGESKIEMHGNTEAGYAYLFAPSKILKLNHFFLDSFNMNMKIQANDKTRIVLHKSLTFTPTKALAGVQATTTAGALARFNSAGAYLSPVGALVGAGSSSEFTFHVNRAYLEHQCADKVVVQAGLLGIPYGIESLNWDRSQNQNWLYSSGHHIAQLNNWFYDVGLGLIMTDVIPGKLEVAVTDGRQNTSGAGTIAGAAVTPSPSPSSPALAARWHYKHETDSFSVTPVVSVNLSRWRGGAKDLGWTAGLMAESGMLSANFEWMAFSSERVESATGTDLNRQTLYFEPTFDLGVVKASAKFDLHWTSVGTAAKASDWDAGVTLTHEYNDHHWVRAIWMHTDNGSKSAAVANSISVVWGASW